MTVGYTPQKGVINVARQLLLPDETSFGSAAACAAGWSGAA